MTVNDAFEAYLRRYPGERGKLELLAKQFAGNQNLNDRKNFSGHITGAAIVLSPDCQKVLMVHHRILDRWLQPGGHWDPEETDPLEAARREAVEETGVHLGELLAPDPAQPLVPVQIDTHFIPANPAKDEAEHYHHDFRYAFKAIDEDLAGDEAETKDVRWFDLDAPETSEISEALRRVRGLLRPES